MRQLGDATSNGEVILMLLGQQAVAAQGHGEAFLGQQVHRAGDPLNVGRQIGG